MSGSLNPPPLQLAHREELPPSGIFPMPSIQFLETLLDDLGTSGGGGGSNGSADAPPLGLPPDAFDLDLRPTPFDQAAAAASMTAQQAQRGGLVAYHQLSLAQQASKGCVCSSAGMQALLWWGALHSHAHITFLHGAAGSGTG